MYFMALSTDPDTITLRSMNIFLRKFDLFNSFKYGTNFSHCQWKASHSKISQISWIVFLLVHIFFDALFHTGFLCVIAYNIYLYFMFLCVLSWYPGKPWVFAIGYSLELAPIFISGLPQTPTSLSLFRPVMRLHYSSSP